MEMRLSQEQHSPHLSPSSHAPTVSSNLSLQPLCQSAASGLQWVSELWGGLNRLLVLHTMIKLIKMIKSMNETAFLCLYWTNPV